MSAYNTYEEIQKASLASAATGTDMDKAKSISKDDPSWFWLAADIVGTIADVFAAWTSPVGSEGLGIVDFEIFPHLDNPVLPENTMADAERWAREATSSAERGYAANMTLAEALHLQGRLSESVTVFGELPAELNNDSQALEMYGRLSAARNQHLRSTRTFQQAIDLGSTKPGELWYWSGVSALERRDFSSASTALDRAHASGELPALVQEAHEKLDRQTSPMFSLPVRLFGDSNDLSVRQTGVRGQIWPSLAVPLFGEVVAGEV